MSMIIALAMFAAMQEPLTDQECLDATGQMMINACSAQRFERADAELNRIWTEMIAGAREDDRSPDSGRTAEDQRSEEEILRTAQRAWIAFRDAHCEYEGLSERGGSMEPMIVSDCMAELTRQRIAQLSPPPAADQPEQ